jgi:hypothetical protein
LLHSQAIDGEKADGQRAQGDRAERHRAKRNASRHPHILGQFPPHRSRHARAFRGIER